MRLFHSLISQVQLPLKTYVSIPSSPTFTDTNTITPSGNQSIFTATLGGKTDQLIAPGQASAWVLNGIGGTLSTPIRFKSQSPTNKAVIGDGSVTTQRCVRTLNATNHYEMYDVILYENQGGISLSGGGSEATAVSLTASNLECHRHTFAGIWCNTGTGHYDHINTSFFRAFDLDGGAADGTDGGEGYYLGNTSNGNRSLIYTSRHNHVYINKAAREGIQITSVFDLEMNNMTIRNSGTWGAAGTGQNRMGQYQHSNGIVRDTIWDEGASSFEVFSHGITFYNNYFRWTNADRFYIGNPTAEPQLNGEPVIFDNCVFKSTSGTNPLMFVVMNNADIIIRNCIISNNISSLFTDNRGGGATNELIDGGGNTYVPAASIPDPTYTIEPGFDLHLTYADTSLMAADQANQTNGRRYLAGSTYYMKKAVTNTGTIADYIITEPAYVVSSDYHYNRSMGYRTPVAPIQPTNITLDDVIFDDGNAINAVIGNLATVGGSGSYNYSIVTTGYRSEDAAAFNISGSQLRASIVFEASTKDEYYVRIRSTSATNSMRYVERVFLITIAGGATVATDITLTPSSVNENVSIGTTVGVLSDNGYPSSTWSLVAGTGSTDNASFSISGSNLNIQVSPDYETKTSYAIRVRSTNTANGALTYEEQMTVTVNDLADGITSEYTAILSRASSLSYTAPSSGQQTQQNQIIVDLKAQGIWTKLDNLYVFANDGSYQFGFINWKSPTVFAASRPGNAVWNVNQGFEYGTNPNGHIVLDWAPSEGVNFTQNDASFMLGKNASGTVNTYAMSESTNNANRTILYTHTSTTSTYYAVNNSTSSALGGLNVADAGIYYVERSASNAIALYKNNTLLDSRTTTSATRSTQDVVIAGYKDFDDASVTSGGSTGEIRFIAFGARLNSTERTAFYNIMNTYLSGL